MACQLVHDGTRTVRTPPFDPDTDQKRGFKYELKEGEIVASSDWMINDISVAVGESVSGLQLVGSEISAEGIAIARLAFVEEVVVGTEYRVSNLLGTNYFPKDKRTMVFEVRSQ